MPLYDLKIPSWSGGPVSDVLTVVAKSADDAFDVARAILHRRFPSAGISGTARPSQWNEASCTYCGVRPSEAHFPCAWCGRKDA